MCLRLSPELADSSFFSISIFSSSLFLLLGSLITTTLCFLFSCSPPSSSSTKLLLGLFSDCTTEPTGLSLVERNVFLSLGRKEIGLLSCFNPAASLLFRDLLLVSMQVS